VIAVFCLTAVCFAEPATREDDQAARHLIVVNPRGQPMYPVISRQNSGNYRVTLVHFKSEQHRGSYKDHIENIVSEIEKRRDHKVLFFIHGGMNVVQGAAERAATIYAKYRDHSEGYRDLDQEGYPLFLCWDSPFTGYAEQVAYVRAGKTERYGRSVGHKLFAFTTLPFHLLSDLGRGLLRFPEDWSQFAHNDLYIVAPSLFSEYGKMQEEVKYLRGEAKDCKNSSDRDRIDVSNVEPVKKSTRYLSDAQTILLFPLRNLTLPPIDSIGVGAWDNMLRHTETMFDRTDTETHKHHTPVEEAVTPEETGAIAKFFARLSTSHDSEKLKITLVGHSMGAIICNRIINSYPDLEYSNIVYMGAACSVREFESCVVPYLNRHHTENSPPQFYSLSLHPRCEAGEIALMPMQPSARFSLDIAPRGSLPVWIDNIFAHPPSEGQRRYGIYQTAILASHNIPRDVRCQVHLKCFTYGDAEITNGLVGNPQHHSDFAGSPFWRRTFWRVKSSSLATAAN
jgi:hypothetical protein